jgi:transcriptional regulator with XRE-family HTH domain
MNSHKTGAQLRDAREIAGLTQQQVADEMGLFRTTIVGWEAKALVKAPKAAAYLRAVQKLAP